MPHSLIDVLRDLFGRGAKKASPFKSEQEAYDFCEKAYRESGGVSPELRRAFDFYMKHANEQTCGKQHRLRSDYDQAHAR